MKFSWNIVLFVIFLLLFPLDQTYAERRLSVITHLTHKNSDIGTYKALIIGIDQYLDQAIPDLETAVADAKSMAKLLQTRYGFSIDYGSDLLINQKATKEAIYNALRGLTASAGPSDSVLIYYAGHGDLDQLYNDGWWIPADAKAGEPLTYLDNVQVQKAMRNMRSRHVLLISDSCYSGTLFGQSRALPKVINDKYYLGLFNEKSRWGMTSGNKTPVADQGTSGHSVFAYQLLKTLRENTNPYISTQEIYIQIAPIISNNSEVGQVPMCSPILLTGDQGGQFIFVATDSPSSNSSVKPPETFLTVDANISGAKVYLDQRYLGKTPINAKEITSGRHNVRVIKQGYQPYLREIIFDEGRKKSLQAILERETVNNGRMSVRTNPENATIKILNIRPTFFQGIELVPGDYHLEVSSDGYETIKIWISLMAGEDKDIDIHLNPLPGKIPYSPTGDVGGKLTAMQNQHIETRSKITNTAPSAKLKNSLGMEFVFIPSGRFRMGSNGETIGRRDDETEHQVFLSKGFYLQTTEVTQGQWQAVMGSNPSWFKSCGENCPVETVSWNDVQAFIRKLNQEEINLGRYYRLPKEAEWEYVAQERHDDSVRGAEKHESGCRKNTFLDVHGWYCYNSNRSIHPVADKEPNDWGVYDMHGNVWEWVDDWYDQNYYLENPIDDPKGPDSGIYKVVRGGSWYSTAELCRFSLRNYYEPGYKDSDCGFRLTCISKNPTGDSKLASLSDQSGKRSDKSTIFPNQTLNKNDKKQYQNSLGMAFVHIPAGSFIMGSPQEEKGRRTDEVQHKVTLTEDFYMQTTEVTQAQWQALMGENPSKFNQCGQTCPVEQVSWRDVQNFIHKLNLKEQGRSYRLPTEAEWEYAARSGSAAAFINGNITQAGCQEDPSLDAMAWYCHNSDNTTHPVARKSPNAWGVYDMQGNVSEWVYDWYDKDFYLNSPPIDPVKATLGEGHVLRGGSWQYSAKYCRLAQRYSSTSTATDDTNGFRLIYFLN